MGLARRRPLLAVSQTEGQQASVFQICSGTTPLLTYFPFVPYLRYALSLTGTVRYVSYFVYYSTEPLAKLPRTLFKNLPNTKYKCIFNLFKNLSLTLSLSLSLSLKLPAVRTFSLTLLLCVFVASIVNARRVPRKGCAGPRRPSCYLLHTQQHTDTLHSHCTHTLYTYINKYLYMYLKHCTFISFTANILSLYTYAP